MIQLYWDIGRWIVEKQHVLGWGDAVVEVVSADLRRAFPLMTGFSPRNVWYMRRFFEVYGTGDFLQQAVAELKQAPGSSTNRAQPVAILGAVTPSGRFLPQLVAEIPWGHHRLLIDKISDPAARLYYLRATARFGWSRNVLLNQIKAGAYERAVTEKKTNNFPLALPEYLAEQADEAMKSSYNLEFLGIRREVKERELEDRLISRLQAFILELEHAGKMDFYLNLLNDKERGEGDRPSIGIILCAETPQNPTARAVLSRRYRPGTAGSIASFSLGPAVLRR